jgi:hypothetical protein
MGLSLWVAPPSGGRPALSLPPLSPSLSHARASCGYPGGTGGGSIVFNLHGRCGVGVGVKQGPKAPHLLGWPNAAGASPCCGALPWRGKGSALFSLCPLWLPRQSTALQCARTALQYASALWEFGPPWFETHLSRGPRGGVRNLLYRLVHVHRGIFGQLAICFFGHFGVLVYIARWR